MLLLGVHTVEMVTAKVPFSMIILQDHIKRRSIPEELRLRLVIPTSGLQSISLWDAPDVESLKEWLDANLSNDCQSEVSEVQEEFSYGLAVELARVRTADKVAEGSKATVEVIGERTRQAAEVVSATASRAMVNAQQGLATFDQRTGVITTAKDVSNAAVTRVSSAVAQVAENERVSAVVTSMHTASSAAWRKVGMGLSWVGNRVASTVQQPTDDPYQPQQESPHGVRTYFDIPEETMLPSDTARPPVSSSAPAAHA